MNKRYIIQKGQSTRETGFIGYTRHRAQANKITQKIATTSSPKNPGVNLSGREYFTPLYQ